MPMAYRSAPKQSSGSILEPYVPYIHRRWVEGCHNALLQLWRAIKKKGYSGQGGRSPQVLKASVPQVGTTDARAARHLSRCKNHLRASRLQARGVVAAEAEGGSFSRTTNVCGAVVPTCVQWRKGYRRLRKAFGRIVGERWAEASNR